MSTPIIETWSDNEKIYFLGEWCKLYSNKGEWESIDHEVIPYHWDDRNKLKADYNYLSVVFESVLVW